MFHVAPVKEFLRVFRKGVATASLLKTPKDNGLRF